jgi:LTXXQ motif family protein
MLKVMLAGATALALAGSTLVYAQQRSDAPAHEQRAHSRAQFSADDAQAFADARIAALKAGLRLTPDQEKNWPAVESALKDLSKARIDRMAEWRKEREARADQPRDRDMVAALRQRADAMSKRAAGLQKLADAADPLYKSLDDGQKRRLAVLTRDLRPGAGHRWHWRGRDRDDGPRERRG